VVPPNGLPVPRLEPRAPSCERVKRLERAYLWGAPRQSLARAPTSDAPRQQAERVAPRAPTAVRCVANLRTLQRYPTNRRPYPAIACRTSNAPPTWLLRIPPHLAK